MKYFLYDGDGQGVIYCKNKRIKPDYIADSDLQDFCGKCREQEPDVCILSGVTDDYAILPDILRSMPSVVTVISPDGSDTGDKAFLASFLESIPPMNGDTGSRRLIYGYRRSEDGKITVNSGEADVIHRIFSLYAEDKKGTLAVAEMLNREGKLTGRGKPWNQVAVSRILIQPLYMGQNNPACAVVSRDLYQKAQEVLNGRVKNFSGQRKVESYMFSGLIRCKCCGSVFRRLSRHYKNDYIRWVCMERNMKGKDACPNRVAVDEEELLTAVKQYFETLLESQTGIQRMILTEYRRINEDGEERAEEVLNRTFRDMREAVEEKVPSNYILSRLLDKIVIDEDGTVDIDLAIFSELGVDSRILSGK